MRFGPRKHPFQGLVFAAQGHIRNGTGDKIGQVGAFSWGHKGLPAFGFRYNRIEQTHHVETEGAVEVEVEFYFGQHNVRAMQPGRFRSNRRSIFHILQLR